MTNGIMELDNSEPALARAEALREIGQWGQAVDIAYSVVAAEPDRPDVWALLALLLPQLKMLDEGEKAALRALELDSNSPVALRALAVIRIRQQRPSEAIPLAESAMARAPDCPQAMVVLGIARMTEQRLDEADVLFCRAIDLAQSAEAHANRALLQLRRNDIGAAIAHGEAAVAKKPFLTNIWQLLARLYHGVGRGEDAISALQRAARLEPDNPVILVELGEAYRQGAKLGEALMTLEQATMKFPSLASAWANLGVAQQEAAQIPEAENSYTKALAIDSGLGDVHNNLGALYLQAGDLPRAQASFDSASRCFPGRADLHANRGIAALRAGEWVAALDAIKCSLRIKELPAGRAAFVQCVKNLGNIQNDDEAHSLIVRATQEPWGRPGDLAAVSINLLKQDKAIGEMVGRVIHAWPRRMGKRELFGEIEPRVLVENSILRCLMETIPICDCGLEKLLTTVRKSLLVDACLLGDSNTLDDVDLGFYCVLACQCFINGYVFSLEEDEAEWVILLRDKVVHALDSAADIPVFRLVALAAYDSLCSLPNAALLLERPWPKEVGALLAIQVGEPLAEQRLRADIKPLTVIEDEISVQVQRQYEESPYPRWTRLPTITEDIAVEDYLRQMFPCAPFCTGSIGDKASILVAGCGTGQHSIETAQRFRKSTVIAVDLSLASLGYAVRKTQELGLKNIEYMQADIMELDQDAPRFDVIESVGVLHHLRNPLAGWKILCTMLKPGGFMRLGFYSEQARRDIESAKIVIQSHGFAPTPHGIRQCRQEIMDLAESENAKQVMYRRDFFETNSCRDLLFHCQEHLFTLAQIKQALETLDLTFIGFTLESPLIAESYRARFPMDRQMVDLDSWDLFEAENPMTFKSMYQFWVQKKLVE